MARHKKIFIGLILYCYHLANNNWSVIKNTFLAQYHKTFFEPESLSHHMADNNQPTVRPIKKYLFMAQYHRILIGPLLFCHHLADIINLVIGRLYNTHAWPNIEKY